MVTPDGSWDPYPGTYADKSIPLIYQIPDWMLVVDCDHLPKREMDTGTDGTNPEDSPIEICASLWSLGMRLLDKGLTPPQTPAQKVLAATGWPKEFAGVGA